LLPSFKTLLHLRRQLLQSGIVTISKYHHPHRLISAAASFTVSGCWRRCIFGSTAHHDETITAVAFAASCTFFASPTCMQMLFSDIIIAATAVALNLRCCFETASAFSPLSQQLFF
jgi:hypothetical protein